MMGMRTSEVPLFGPEVTRGPSDNNAMRELYENRYKLLRDDNEMLRENLRREQQVDILKRQLRCDFILERC